MNGEALVGFEQRGLALADVVRIDSGSMHGPLLYLFTSSGQNYKVVEGTEGDNTYKGQLSSYALRS